ncbi:MAG TPA: hypothetical protein DCX27_15145 [Balneola sp.]|nr:hypothetical protein [Balneola sp.]
MILKRDVLNFSASPSTNFSSNFGNPYTKRDSRYTETTFQFDSGTLNTEHTDLFVAGDFNSWKLNKESQLKYNPSTDLWTTRFIIKQGNYRYKYFQRNSNFENSSSVPINDSITNRYQEYRAFVYYRDPVKNYHRLLFSDSFNSRK